MLCRPATHLVGGIAEQRGERPIDHDDAPPVVGKGCGILQHTEYRRELRPTPGESLLGLHAPADVSEKHRHPVVRFGADPEGMTFARPASRFRACFETLGNARAGDLPAGGEPVLFVTRNQLGDGSADHSDQPAAPLECRVGVQETVVARPAGAVEQHLDDTDALIKRVE
jgi:hypothetical protein